MSEQAGTLGRWFRRFRGAGTGQAVGATETAVPIERCAAREVVEIVGEITALESCAQESRVGLAATLSDATGSVVLLWMGRPSVSGIEVGRRMRVQGRLAQWHDRPAIYNPRYELLA